MNSFVVSLLIALPLIVLIAPAFLDTLNDYFYFDDEEDD